MKFDGSSNSNLGGLGLAKGELGKRDASMLMVWVCVGEVSLT